MSGAPKRPVLLVSSTVYGIEELLERVYAVLTAFGYEVWMSHKGTVPVRSDRTAFENCLDAVVRCDLFFGIITPSYGSGKDGDGLSVTHQEIRHAIDLGKLAPALEHGLVAMTIPDRPRSRHQRYRLTPLGRQTLGREGWPEAGDE